MIRKTMLAVGLVLPFAFGLTAVHSQIKTPS